MSIHLESGNKTLRTVNFNKKNNQSTLRKSSKTNKPSHPTKEKQTHFDFANTV